MVTSLFTKKWQIIFIYQKQSLVTLSTCKAEFVALSEACRAASWIRRILTDLKQQQNEPTVIYEDNQSCLELIEREQRLSERSKHIDTRFYFVKDYIDKGSVKCIYCPTNEMLAYSLTKALNATKFIEFRNLFGLHDWGGVLHVTIVQFHISISIHTHIKHYTGIHSISYLHIH